MLQIFEQRNKVLLAKYPSHFIEDVLRHTELASTNYNFIQVSGHISQNHQKNPLFTKSEDSPKQSYASKYQSGVEQKLHDMYNGDHVFFGYPNGNYLKQVSKYLQI